MRKHGSKAEKPSGEEVPLTQDPETHQPTTGEKHSSPLGEIEFKGFENDRPSKYIRLDHSEDMDVVMKVLTKQWKLELPEVVISVTGDAKNYENNKNKMTPKRAEIFRRGLMKAVDSTDNGTSRPVPVICVLMGGGKGALEFVNNAIKRETPVVIIAESGRYADILAYAYKTTDAESIREQQIKERIKNEGKPRNLKQLVKWVIECSKDENKKYLTLFNPKETQLHHALLKGLIKAKTGDTFSKLVLALEWNIIDIAQNVIFTNEEELKEDQQHKLMFTAITKDRVDFVDLLMENGFSLKGFVDYLKDTHEEDKKEENGYFVRELYGEIHKLMKNKPPKPCEEQSRETDAKIPAAEEMFFCAVLKQKQNMAMLFWEQVKDRIASAISAQIISQAMIGCRTDSQEKRRWQEQSNYFGEVAVGVLDQCYERNEGQTKTLHDLLVREVDVFGKTSVLRLAVKAKNKKFISHTTSENVMSSIWWGEIDPQIGLKKLVLCMLFPPLVLCLRVLQTDDEHKNEDSTGQEGGENQGFACGSRSSKCLTKIRDFIEAPWITFLYNCVSYLFFLLIYSYVLLVEFTDARMYPGGRMAISVWEILLYVWAGSFTMEEIRQVITHTKSPNSSFRKYITDMWNVLDVIAISLFITGLVLRFVPPGQCDECFRASRFISGISLLVFYIRMLRMLSVNKTMGPKLIMIRTMITQDLSLFIVILMVFVISYGIAIQAMMYPGSDLNFDLFRNVMQRPYFKIFGEMLIDEIEGQSCPAEPCPEEMSRKVVPFIMGVYMTISNVVLMNLLIAMFSSTYDKIHHKSDQHWHYQRYFLVTEYYDRPPLPPPLILFCHIYLIIRWVKQKIRLGGFKCDKPNAFQKKVENEKSLLMFEKFYSEKYRRRTKSEENASQGNRIKEIDERTKNLAEKVEVMSEWGEEIKELRLAVIRK